MLVKRVIRINNPLLQSIRNNSRLILLIAINEKKREIYERRKRLLLDSEENLIPINQLGEKILFLYKKLGNEWWKLERSLKKSILICSLCSSSIKNMVYNHEKCEWFCEDCNLKLVE
ncbi:hypothetical protein LCGC14_0982700 [marine sediment metagenome]|uniref:Uncharacterized protein n=1 Tax=marine sediment metagenome TaxID=412755 RepID=A0A0F9QRK7_9ZZZZ